MDKKAYKFRIYPNVKQAGLLNKTFGTVRKFWNECVCSFNSYDKDYNPKPKYDSSKEFREKYEWAKEISASPIQQKFRDFIEVSKQYFSKTRKSKLGRMKFKSRHHSKSSYRLPNQKFKILENKIQLEKIGKVNCVFDLSVEGKILSCTISKNKSNQYFVSIVTNQEIREKEKTNKSIGIDLGISKFLTDSNGETVENPKFLEENQTKIKRIQKFLSKKKKGSRRFKKLKLRLARLHRDVVNKRDHFLHQIANKIIQENDIVCVEDLDIQGMLKEKKLSRRISDVSWSRFIQFLEYKCNWYGKKLVKIDRFFPSTKTCSACGAVKEMGLEDRKYICDCCGLSLDRDVNAAYNILALGANSA